MRMDEISAKDIIRWQNEMMNATGRIPPHG
jgi:hypothetical protein